MILTKSIITAGTGLLMYTGAGCFAPTIVEDDGNVVTLKYGPWATQSEILAKADAMCGEYDKVAELTADVEIDLEPGFHYATFSCLADEPPVT
jgi:hypothetical protein